MLIEGVKDVDGYRPSLADHVIGTLFLVTAAGCIIAARAIIFLLPILFFSVLAVACLERQSLREFLKPTAASVPVAMFLVYAALSASWSADAHATLECTSIALFTLLECHVVTRWLATQAPGRIRHLAFWTVVGVLIGGAILLHEAWTNQLLRRLLDEQFGLFELSRHARTDSEGNLHLPSSELNRSIAVANMLLWPTLLCVRSLWSGRKAWKIALALVVVTGLTTVGSVHETSKLAIIVGLLCFAVAYRWTKPAMVIAATAWTALVLGCIVVAHLAYDPLGLHKASWVQKSAQERFMIWNDVANRVAAAPVLGAGVRTGYVLSDRSKLDHTYNPVPRGGTTVARHAHNVYLQNWFELGLIGALLFLVAGLAIVRGVTDLPERTKPFALATFSVFSIEIASSWELWQSWFASLFALTGILLTLAIRSWQVAAIKGPATD